MGVARARLQSYSMDAVFIVPVTMKDTDFQVDQDRRRKQKLCARKGPHLLHPKAPSALGIQNIRSLEVSSDYALPVSFSKPDYVP